jgi:general secretion pathway protein F
MPQFRYRAITPAGEMVVGEVDAPSRDEVMRRIEYLGHLPIEAELAAKRMLQSAGASRLSAPRPREVTLFLRQLTLFVGAGFTLEASLQCLADGANKSIVRFARNLRSSISSGDSFADALANHSSALEPAYIAMVRAGEASGKLESVLHAIVEDRGRREQLSERINSAIRYPLFLIVSAILILFLFLIYVVPQFETVFEELGNRLNTGATLVLTASVWLRANLDLLLGMSLVAVLAAWLLLQNKGRRRRLIGILGSIPGIAGAVRDRRTARLVSTLGLLVGNGVALPAALKILREVVSDPRQVAAVDRLHEQVRGGRRFTDALAETDLLPPLAVRMLRVGDDTGDLPTISQHVTRFYEHQLSVSLDRIMGAIGPVAIILVSVLVGALVISIMTALLNITELAS